MADDDNVLDETRELTWLRGRDGTYGYNEWFGTYFVRRLEVDNYEIWFEAGKMEYLETRASLPAAKNYAQHHADQRRSER